MLHALCAVHGLESNRIEIEKGLDLPFDARPPDNLIDDKQTIKKIALLGRDYVGMKPTLRLKLNENVKKGMKFYLVGNMDQVIEKALT